MNHSKHTEFQPCIDVSGWITLRWVRGTRYYRVHLEQDLWRNWLLTQVNGRRGTRLGKARSKPEPSIESALLDLAAIAARRRKRGYELTSAH
jgi:WGR domain